MFTMSREAALEIANEEGMIVIDGFDDAILGFSSQCGENTVLAYDIEKMVSIFSQREDVSYSESYEYIEYNCIGAYMGDGNPVYIRVVDEAGCE
jgi:hypothetical protein